MTKSILTNRGDGVVGPAGPRVLKTSLSRQGTRKRVQKAVGETQHLPGDGVFSREHIRNIFRRIQKEKRKPVLDYVLIL